MSIGRFYMPKIKIIHSITIVWEDIEGVLFRSHHLHVESKRYWIYTTCMMICLLEKFGLANLKKFFQM